MQHLVMRISLTAQLRTLMFTLVFDLQSPFPFLVLGQEMMPLIGRLELCCLAELIDFDQRTVLSAGDSSQLHDE